MDPTPDTPFADVPAHWLLEVACACKLVYFSATWRARHYRPDMTARELLARLRCAKCVERGRGDGRPRAAVYADERVGIGGLRLHPEARVVVLGEDWQG